MDKSLQTPTIPQLPDWLMPVPQHSPAEVAQIKRDIEQSLFEAHFERVIDTIAQGNPLSAALDDLPSKPHYGRYLAWIMRDENRKQRYYEAQEIGGEVVANQMIDIADADDTIEDVARSTLRINTRKWLLGVWNRKRFGETKQVDQTVTINLVDAMAEAQARVDNSRTVDVQSRIVNEG